MLIRSEIRHRRDAVAGLNRSIASLCADIVKQPIYVDTVQALVRPYFTGGEISTLARLNQTRHLRLTPSKLWAHQAVRLHQPTRNALLALDLMRPNCIVNRVDVSVDLCVKNGPAQDRVAMLVTRHLTQRWPADRCLFETRGTNYYSHAWPGRNLVVYREASSRSSGLPCVHVEARMTSAAICKAYGVLGPLDLLSADLVEICHRNYRFTQVAWAKVEKRIWQAVDRDILLRGDAHDEYLEDLIARQKLERIARNVASPNIAEARMQSLITYEQRWVRKALYHQDLRALINPQRCSFPQ